MPSLVICVAGPLQGQEFVLGESGLTIGRHASNDITLDEVSVSRRHCVIRHSPEGFVIADQSSHNHTWVNGIPITEQLLRTGDQICIGGATFHYVAEGAQPVEIQPESDDGTASSSITMVLRRDEAVLLQPQTMLDAVRNNSESLRAVKLLLTAIEAMSSGGSLVASASRLLDLVGGVLPVTTAGLFLADDGEEATLFWPEGAATRCPITLPKAVLRRVVNEKVSICTSDIRTDRFVDPSESVVNSPARAVIAVPVVAEDRVIGVLHGAAAHALFDASHLQLLTGVAGVAASHLAAGLRVQKLEKENVRLQEQVRIEANLIGNSPQMAALHAVIGKVAPTASTVLIVGESGTGKELVASAIHRNSPRATKPFIAINCAALTETLLESELFGHEKGAFTGAATQKRGKFEEANGGTLFLDEVGELAQTIQAKLLRVLQERTLTRVGGNHAMQVDVRVIAATNRDLRAMVRSGEFRQDLYFRLNVITIQTPALRERRTDIPDLADHFIRKHSGSARRRITGVSSRSLRILARYDWPGNVRELENVIERALVLGSTESIVPDDLPDTLLESGAGEETSTNFHHRVNKAKRNIIVAALQKNQGSYSEAARELGIHPNNLHRLIRSLELKLPEK